MQQAYNNKHDPKQSSLHRAMAVAKAAIEITWIQWEDRNNIVHATHTIAESAQMDTTITIMLKQG
jgi:hypothetical protein